MGASPSSLIANTKYFNVSNGGAPSFGCVIGDRGCSEYANSISSVGTAPSFSDLCREVASRSGDDQNLDEVKFEEASWALNGGEILPCPNLRIFTFSELKSATRSFRSDAVLGEGGFGKVYKGWLEDKSNSKHNVIAIKKLNSESMSGFEDEWQAEVDFLGRLSHPNLVKLFGYCHEGTELLLVYEFMQKGSLENHLFGRGSIVQPLPWDIRLKILIGAARGLMFLYTSKKQVIYRDFKTSNILLDGSYNAKLSDFGLAKMGLSASQSYVTTRVMGTYDYVAPEYVSTGHLYVKSDVYGFGIVMVEMLTGMRAFDLGRPVAQQNLSDWVKPYLAERRKLKNIMDSRLEGRYPFKVVNQIAQLAFTCLQPEPKTRPSMKEVVEKLEQLDAIKERAEVPRVHNSTHHSPYRHGQQPPNHRPSPQTQSGNRRSPKGWWNYKKFTKGSLALQ